MNWKNFDSKIPGIITFKNSLRTFTKDIELEVLSEKELDKLLQKFKENGTVFWETRKSGIYDYSQILSLGLERGLFIFSDGVYLDYQRKTSIFINKLYIFRNRTREK